MKNKTTIIVSTVFIAVFLLLSTTVIIHQNNQLIALENQIVELELELEQDEDEDEDEDEITAYDVIVIYAGLSMVYEIYSDNYKGNFSFIQYLEVFHSELYHKYIELEEITR